MATRVHVTELGFVVVLDARSLPGARYAPVAAMVAGSLGTIAVLSPLDPFQRGVALIAGLVALVGAGVLRLRAVHRSVWLRFDGSVLAVEDVDQPGEHFAMGELVSAGLVGRQLLLRRIDGLLVPVDIDPADPALSRVLALLEQVVNLSVRRSDDADARAERDRVVGVTRSADA